MPILCEFNTPQGAQPRPRLSHGIRKLDKCWSDKLRSAVANILIFPPADLDFLTGEHMRRENDPADVRIEFERQFVTPPKVVVFLNVIDLDKDCNWRLNTWASAIDVSGFTLHIDTWGNTGLHAAQACWIAYPEDRTHIFGTSVNTMDIRPVTQPQAQQSTDILFGPTVAFWKTPTVFVALNYLDVDCKAPLRIDAHVDGVSTTGLVCHIDSWCDTVLYAAGASIIAFNY